MHRLLLTKGEIKRGSEKSDALPYILLYLIYPNPFLLHGVAAADGDGVVFQCIVIDCNAERCAPASS